jgi:H+-transporting ATPase
MHECVSARRLTLDKEEVLAWAEHTADDVLRMAALSAKWENNDAIDRAVTGALPGRGSLAEYEILRLTPFNPVDKKTVAAARTADGRVLMAAKGAPQVRCSAYYLRA